MVLAAWTTLDLVAVLSQAACRHPRSAVPRCIRGKPVAIRALVILWPISPRSQPLAIIFVTSAQLFSSDTCICGGLYSHVLAAPFADGCDRPKEGGYDHSKGKGLSGFVAPGPVPGQLTSELLQRSREGGGAAGSPSYAIPPHVNPAASLQLLASCAA